MPSRRRRLRRHVLVRAVDGLVIRTPDQRLRVFVSSTLGELADERRAVARAITALRLTPVMFEAGARPHPPRELYQSYLAQSDVFIGIYWQRYGQVNADMEVSGLEEEFLLSGTEGLPRLLYVKTPAPDREPRLAELLARISEAASYRRFSTPAELGRLVRNDLAALLSERFAASSAVSAAQSSSGSRRLPADTTSLVGREQAINEVADLLGRPDFRLVTLTGPGGVGKTRLALAVGELLRDRFDEVVFVPLETATRPEQVLVGIARAVGADLAGTDSPVQALVEQLAGSRWLLILDNLEQVLDAAGDLAELLARSANVAILATSRTVLGLMAEHDYPVPPLLLADDVTVSPATLIASPAVALFVDRARAVRPDFALTEGNVAAVAEICQLLEGLPLAIELAAARIRLLDPGELLRRLATSLDALGTGSVDMPQRQHTLRDTVQWSVDLLDEDERSLLETMAIFVDGWTVEAAGQVAGLDEDRALDLSEALERSSLIQLDSAEPGPRLRMLNIIRGFVAERLAARPDVAEIGSRHADYYRALAEGADRPLRGLDQDHAAGGLEAEAANLAAAVGWYLAYDRRPLPHLFRVLWLFWGLRDHLGEARGWIDQLLPTADSLEPHDQAELLWTAAVTAVEVVGEDQATLAAAGQRLESLLARISDPYLHAVSLAVMSGIAGVLGDLDGALRTELACLEELRGQDEPYWTTVAILTVGLWEAALGRHEAALGHLREARTLADRFDHAGLSAWSQVQLGILAIMRGRPEEAWALLDEGLELSLATHSTRNVTLCLTAFAQLAFVQGDGERAALLEGAAEGLRQRVGLRVWPLQQQGEAQAVAQIRQALGADRFDQDFAAGVRLNRQQAIAAVRGPRSTGTAASS
jgi:predicted ATPase